MQGIWVDVSRIVDGVKERQRVSTGVRADLSAGLVADLIPLL